MGQRKSVSAVEEWPQGQIINWSALAREFNIPGRNNGQVVAVENGIDVFMLDHRPSNTRLRARKLRMPGGQISVPAHRTVEGVKEDWKRMIKLGELTLGEPCYPQTLCKYTIKGGELQHSETVVYGRKIPLIEVRRKHECLMHLHSDEEIACFTKSHLLELYNQHHIQLPSNLYEETLQTTLKQYERTRSIGIWHDHSTILGRGYILLTAKVLYDPAIFNSSSIHALSIKNVQAFVEEPEICMIAMSSSSINDQAALITDRVSCIQDMSQLIMGYKSQIN